jgi:hypothetical protein
MTLSVKIFDVTNFPERQTKMVSRLFGRTKKNPTPQEPQPQVSTPVETEDEGFTILGGTPQLPRSGPAPIYPNLSPGETDLKTENFIVKKTPRK